MENNAVVLERTDTKSKWNYDKRRKSVKSKKYKSKKAPRNVCPSGSRIIQGLGLNRIDDTNNFSSVATNNSKRRKDTKDRVLIFSTAQHNIRHILAFSSQLECFTLEVVAVILTVSCGVEKSWLKLSNWRKQIFLLFARGIVSIKSEYFENFRYDVGLWCDAISTFNDISWKECTQDLGEQRPSMESFGKRC